MPASSMRTFLLPLALLLAFSTILEGSLTKPFVYLVYLQNATCMDFKAVPACFGAPLPWTGLTGYLVEAMPANACQPIRAPPALRTSPPGFIALIRRYGCSFGVKVLHAQQAGYRAAIIHNLYSDLLVSMSMEGGEPKRNILIPSLFIGGSASTLLRRWVQTDNRTKVTVVVPRSYHNPCWNSMDLSVWDAPRHYFQFWPGYCSQRMIVGFLQEFGIAILLSMGFSLFLFAACVKWYRRSRGIHVKTFKRGDHYDLCVICMTEYEIGDLLKILPCGHAYHSTCINTWLVIQPRTEKTCPICKQKVNTAL